jgi:hypothetical protein
MCITRVISDALTKWHIQRLLLLAVVSFLNSAMLQFGSIIRTCYKAEIWKWFSP